MEQAPRGWASCPLTQHGFLRVISQPKYPKPLTTRQAFTLLQSTTAHELHEFWPADLTLLDESRIDPDQVHGPAQLTDLYLLALAVSRGGCLATFDETIPRSAVQGATSRHLVTL